MEQRFTNMQRLSYFLYLYSGIAGEVEYRGLKIENSSSECGVYTL